MQTRLKQDEHTLYVSYSTLHDPIASHTVDPHLLKLYFNATSSLETKECWGANGNKQLTDPLVDPYPVCLLVLCIAEELK